MKLLREFKSTNHETPKDRILIAEDDDLEQLRTEAERIALKHDMDIDLMWNNPLSDTTSVVLLLKIDNESELVIRR